LGLLNRVEKGKVEMSWVEMSKVEMSKVEMGWVWNFGFKTLGLEYCRTSRPHLFVFLRAHV
jgi:hypothetical protein